MTSVKPPYIIITACSQSHAFEERRVNVPTTEDEPLKIGRSVAKWKPSNENAIFDCKVLSRNHAILWYEEGCFYLKDTKSSNGTFVNNERLSKSGEESAPRQVFSGDILQFGVDIVENTNKVTHGCIVAMVRLFDGSGEEVRAPDRSSSDPGECNTGLSSLIKSHQLFQLQQYVREAAHKERLLDQKLESLETVLAVTEQATENSWQALINEDRLLSRIEMLEGQLALYAKNVLTDKVKEEMSQLLEDRNNFENLSKESLRRSQEEKFEAKQRCADVEQSLFNMEEECTAQRERINDLEKELASALNANSNLNDTVVQLRRQLAAVTTELVNGFEGDGRVMESGSVLQIRNSENKEKDGYKVDKHEDAYKVDKQEELEFLKNEIKELSEQNTMLRRDINELKAQYGNLRSVAPSFRQSSSEDDTPIIILCGLPLLALIFGIYQLLVSYVFVKRKAD